MNALSRPNGEIPFDLGPGLEIAESLDARADAMLKPLMMALPIVRASSFAGQAVKPRPWLVRDLIPGRTVTLLGGDGGLGKSTIAKQLAVAVVTGKAWLGQTPEQGAAVFLSAEDDIDELHRRVVEIAQNYGVEVADLGNLHFVPLAGLDAVMGAPETKSGVVAPTKIWFALVDVVERIKPRLVVLDTLADVFAGNENARAEARQFVGLLRGLAIKSDCAVLLLSHPSLDGLRSGSGTSGSTAWNNSVRSRLYLETMKSDDGSDIDPDLRLLRVKKSNYGPAGLEIRLRWHNGCFDSDSPVSGFGKLAAEAKAERVFLDLLDALASQGRDVSPKLSNSYAPAVFDKHPNSAGIRKREFAAAMERLLDGRRIEVEATGPPSRRYSRLVICRPKEEF